MMSNNKILTVSYGTFSCTLEGFDDSFGTMKAIAEYFRDLAADDRYFGAEPPQPDAEMLARIAQREVSRRVSAREHEGKIVLSALEDNSAAPAAAPRQAAPQRATSDHSAPPAMPQAPAKPVETAFAEDTNTIAAEAHVDETTVEAQEAAEGSQRPVQDTGAPTDALPAAGPEAAEVKEELSDTSAPAGADAAVNQLSGAENDDASGQPDDEVGAFFADSPAADTGFEDETPEQAAPEASAAETSRAAQAPAVDSIAAKLQRIRAVVARQDDPAERDSFEDEEATATFLTPAAEPATGPAPTKVADVAMRGQDAVMAARADLEDALDADDATADDATAKAATAEDEEDDYSDILRRLEASESPQAARQNDSLVAEDETASEDMSEDAVSNLFDGEDETPRARVVKVKRADLEAAIERGDLEEDTAPAQAGTPALDDIAPAKTATSSLSAEQEAELADELAALERDIEEDRDRASDESHAEEGETEEEAETERQQAAALRTAAARAALPAIEDAQSGDMTRLMAEADQQMDEPESTTRRNAFAHLRAAVAAKKADVAMGDTGDTADKGDVYRSDLAEVVRPRRPASGGARTPRPEEARPAPLKLVAEQRIDGGASRPGGPVQPRRVAAVVNTDRARDPADGFAAYALETGASSLSQQLEAAAAYLSFVEGRDQFSRPQLMTKVRQSGLQETFSREDGLRCFGQLLRSGKIEKIRGGRFTVSEHIGYRPDERAAG